MDTIICFKLYGIMLVMTQAIYMCFMASIISFYLLATII